MNITKDIKVMVFSDTPTPKSYEPKTLLFYNLLTDKIMEESFLAPINGYYIFPFSQYEYLGEL